MYRRPQPRGFSSAAVFIVGGLLIAIGVAYVVFATRQADVATEKEAAEIKKQAAVKAAPKSATPQVPDNFILSPQFETSTGVFQAGTAFVIKLPNLKRPVVITAIHLFGPAGGLEKQLSAEELSGFVKRANFYNIFENKEQVCTSDIIVPLPSAPFDKDSEAGDVSAFMAEEHSNVPSVELAPVSPKVGDVVYLAAQASEGAPPTQRLHRGVVTTADAKSFMFQYDNAELKVNGTSGAPILNADGQVVGINLAAMQDQQKFIGVAHPVERFVLQLRTATKEIAFKLQSRPDPKPDATAQKTPGQPEPMPDPVMIGQSINLGKVGIQAENFWAEEIGAGEETYNASFIATLTNAGDQAMSLPAMEVTLVDAEGRQFKSSKSKQGTTGVLNPLMKSRNYWAFTLPAQGTMKFAQFKNRDGIVRVDLTARTPENAAHIASEEHIALLQESMLFASPRVAVKIQYDKAKKLMDDAAAEVAAGEMEMARIEKAIEKATAAVEAAKVPLEKARNTSQAALEKVKYIKANWDTLPQRTRAQQQAKADQDLERALRAAGEATDHFKDKEAVVKELGKELKEAEKALKPLRTKFETQQKAVQALEQKL